jgi:PKD repeat protein
MIRRICLSIVSALAGMTISWAADVPLALTPSWTTSEQGVYSTGMIWRDCNRDGIIDVFYSNGNDMARAANTIYLFGAGGPPSSASWRSSNLEYSGHCAVGDVNDDGYPDFMVANYLGAAFGDPNQSDLYLNAGGLPSTTPSWYTPDDLFSFSCAFGDVDNDGDLDVVFATGEGYHSDYQPNLIYRNEGGTFLSTAFWTSANSAASLDVAWGDVDRDGDLDLAFTGDAMATCVYYNNAGTVETSPSWQASTVESGNTLLFGDINGDGWLDLVVAYNNQLGGQGRFRVYFNNGDGTQNPVYGWQSSTGGYGSALALYDYDNDGDDDLATGRWFEKLTVYENIGSTLTTAPVWSSTTDMVAEELAWVDIDADGVFSLVDTLEVDGSRKLFYTRHHPLYEIDSIVADGAALGHAGYCYDLVSGWLSLAEAPASQAICFYRYSFKNDLAVANWDTVNMVFNNTSVTITVDNAFGPVPLAVQFYDNSVDAHAWNWNFGDGFTSTEQNPLHTYLQPGYYDVGIEVARGAQTLQCTVKGMVSAYADTLTMVPGELIDYRARVDISLHNYLPLTQIIIPFTWAGTFNLRYDSMSVAGLRTDYFDQHSMISYVPSLKSIALRLAAGSQPALEAGDGTVVSLYFTDLDANATGSSPVAFTSFNGRTLTLTSYAGDYAPVSTDGVVYVDCCVDRVGDANGVGGDEPTIGDVSTMIDMLFISGNPVDCLAEADLNQSGGFWPARKDITIGDVSTLINYLFITGPSLGLHDCF